MEATVNDIIKVMDGIAPPNLAEPWDNVGSVSYTHLDVYKRQVYYRRRSQS